VSRQDGSAARSTAPQPRAADLEAIAVEAANEGARVVRAAAGDLGTVRTKSTPTDPVTSLDLVSERAIRDVLARRTPDASVLGEEDGNVGGPSSVGWIIDPIDGTVNLTYALPVISVSVAATLNGEVVAGCVVDPHRGDVFSACLDGGARCDGEPISVSGSASLAASLVSTGFDYRSDERSREAQYLARVLPAARDIRCFGSAALNLCWVACGRLDAHYQRKMQLWDYAAGALIAAEAGATIQPPTASNGELMVVASPGILDALGRLVA
jgi:myo-inositol-1(or 4)-monophosphatase